MSDVRNNNNIPGNCENEKIGEITEAVELLEQVGKLCMSSEYSDVRFIVENEKIPAHKNILAARNPFFRSMLYGSLAESVKTEIELPVPLVAFKTLLRYIYTGCVSLSQIKEEDIVDLLGLANQYGMETLMDSISSYFSNIISLENCCLILDAAHLYNIEPLIASCMTFMDANANNLLSHPTLKNISQISLCSLLKRDSFFAEEITIFNAVHDWYQSNEEADVETVFSYVRFSLMDFDQIFQIVRPKGLLSSDQLFDAIEAKTTAKSLPYRGALRPNVKATICKDIIIVELDTICIINHIRFPLVEANDRSYSYFVEVLVNPNCWERIVDHTEFNCRSWQFLYFSSRAVKFIKFVSTEVAKNKMLDIEKLEAKYINTVPELVNGLIKPKYNVATADKGATVLEGINKHFLLNGDKINYDGSSGYTYHLFNNAQILQILIQLGQPYIIDSLKMLLWDGDDRVYSFYIETSTDQKTWDIAVDKRDERLRSWQEFTFNPRPVVFIKIVGTHNSETQGFHCVHFECPSQTLTE